MFKMHRLLTAAAFITTFISVTGLSPVSTAAQASVNVQTFNPAANSSYMYTEDAVVDGTSSYYFSAMYSWTDSPLVVLSSDRSQQLGTVVSGLNTLDLTMGWHPVQRFSLNATLPLNLVQTPDSVNQFAMGDSRLWAKWRLTADHSVLAVSIMPEVFLPTGAQDLFLSSGSAGMGVGLAIEHDFGAFQASANVGYRYNSSNRFEDLNYTQMIPMALGLNIPISGKWAANLEAAGSVVLPTNQYNNPGEVFGGLKFLMARDAILTAGVAAGSVNSVDSASDIRVIAGIKFSPFEKAPIPTPERPIVIRAAAPIQPRVIFTPQEIQLLEEVKFMHNRAELTDSGRGLLDEVAELIKKNQGAYRLIVIEGHANELGGFDYNQKLSEYRASSVKEYLTSRGIPAATFTTIGYGKTRPKAMVRGLPTNVALAANRRVQFLVVK